MPGLFQCCPQVRSIRKSLGDEYTCEMKPNGCNSSTMATSPNLGPGSHATGSPSAPALPVLLTPREAFLTRLGRGWSSKKPWCCLVNTPVRYAVGKGWRVMRELIRDPGTFVPAERCMWSPQTPTQEGKGRWTSNACWSLFFHQQQLCHLHVAQQNITNKEVASLHMVIYVC